MAACAFLSGCVTESRGEDPWAFYRQLSRKLEARSAGNAALFGTRAGRARHPRGRSAERATGWAIRLRRFADKAAADTFARRLAERAGFDDAWVREEDSGAAVYRGRFDRPSGEAAKRALRKTRARVLEGERPFSDAQLVPLGPGARGAADELDLRRHRGRYSLQIGFYDERYPGDRRAAAEARARELREKGHEAYYYHGPNRSLVTVGVFTRDALRQRKGAFQYGPRIRELQKTFPHHRINGEPVVLKEGGPNRERVLQPSFLVKAR